MAWHAPMKSNGVYWIGADGNVYVKGSRGTNNAGRADANTGSYWGSRGFGQIADPMAVKPGGDSPASAPSNPNNVRAAAAPAPAPKPDRSNSIRLNQAGLAQVGSQEAAGISSVDKALAGLMGTYDAEAGTNAARYTESSVTNQQNLQKNKQTSLVNAAQGRQGLMGTLSSIGALNGDGITLANSAVQKGANDDLSGAADTFSTNQVMLDDSIEDFRSEDKRRRDEANQAAGNAKTVVRGQSARDRQGFYSKMSNDYAEMGNEAEARKYADMAGAEYGAIAGANVPNSNIAYSGAAFKPSTLASYMAGADSTVVNATPTQPGQATPGLVASPTKKKEKQLV